MCFGEQDMTLLQTLSYVDALCSAEKKTGIEEDEDEDAQNERNDSSYDSDYEAGDESALHEDISRTVSDTLKAEFDEYVNTNDTSYMSKVEFGLKLGYSEKLVQTALQKLGPNPEQNELLEELIKLGAQGSSRGGSGGGTVGEVNELPPPLLSQECTVQQHQPNETRLRPIVIDGSNVAMSHGNNEVFSCRGIKICVDWFRARGHQEIVVFVPKWRKESPRPDNLIRDQDVLLELERERALVFTPSRLVGGKRMICYDDRYILRLAADMDGIVVSNDNYRDLAQENPEFRKVVNERILMYSFVNDRFMPPEDPLGRSGPTLDNFLSGAKMKMNGVSIPCPYGKKCTYGNKCKFEHPERGPFPQKSVSERLLENAQRQLQTRFSDNTSGKQLTGKSISLPLSSSSGGNYGADSKPVLKTRLSRTKSTNPVCLESSLSDQSQGNSMLGPSGTSIPSGWSMQGSSPTHPVNWPSPNAMNIQYERKHLHQDAPINLHAKLQRQLSLNPTYDPRLHHLQNFAASEHDRVARAASCDIYSPPPEIHQGVTRIASAPLSQHAALLKSQSNLSVPPPVWNVSPTFSHPTEDRNRLRYHLSSIFPQEQVDTVMQMYPAETNAQKLCALILSMFPIGS
ncbi:unnamed protein product [Bemisia tabaci]|uniref:C3H1-type domain-containing protein n=1 Tax=Bemisia tabaci TaxID=7038 RepID=A0A9P0EYH5_BEMTA|nr:PREDICTED: probable ribonuclease ZC3H12D isoform X2 [Bemisia tabaci]CAH0382180.1 unnamed protein product [Bemisia tabaci]